MVRKAKDILYFFIASYFRFFARIRLRRWQPHVVVVTGSNGKTTALHLIALQLGDRARYSFHANSSFGIPFDILGLSRSTYSLYEWFVLALCAPIGAFQKLPKEKIYVAEADCDRPGEGVFLNDLLRPEVVVWLNCARTHSKNFDTKVARGEFPSVDDAIAHEFGSFLAHSPELAIVNGDDLRIMQQTQRSHGQIQTVRESDLRSYAISIMGTEFGVRERTYTLPYVLPKDVFRAIAASEDVAEFFEFEPTTDITHLMMPPGRSTLLRGVKATTILDSSYNINVSSLAAVLSMAKELTGKKWLILGDMTEQGKEEKDEHEKAARIARDSGFERIVLVGPRMRRIALPILQASTTPVESFNGPKEALDYLLRSISGGELLVFKGARFLEGIIEHMLANPSDAEKLCRREAVWQRRRKQWGL